MDRDFFRKRIRSAIQSREVWGLRRDTDSYRLIYAESDQLPGLIVDRYGDVLILQSLTTGIEFWKGTIADLLLEETGLTTIFERSDADVRELEGLEPKVGLLRGVLPQLPVTIHENNLLFNVNFSAGHKTGCYLDQRRNRLRVRELASDRDVLDCFCYTGGFSVNALSGGAKSILSVDSSSDALELCRENIDLNQLPTERHSAIEGDVFHLLRKFRDEGRSFDMIILDPPKFAPRRAC